MVIIKARVLSAVLPSVRFWDWSLEVLLIQADMTKKIKIN